MQIVSAIQKILYATDADSSVAAEAQAMVMQQNQTLSLSPIDEISEERPIKPETQKRRSIDCFEVFDIGSGSRLRLSYKEDISSFTFSMFLVCSLLVL
jgi:hypothetical protein